MRTLQTLSCIFFLLPGLAAHAQVTRTWVGTSADMNTPGNWSPAGVPDASVGDHMLFNGSSTFNTITFPGATFSANAGLGNITVTQAAALNISNSGAAAQVFRLRFPSTITIDPGAGAFNFGTSGSTFFLNFSNNATGHQLINNSSNLATIGAAVTLNASGGTGGHAIFGGTGDWLVSGASTANGLSNGLTKIGSGTLTLSGNNLHTGATTVQAGTLRSGASNVLSDASALTVSGTGAGVTATLNLNGFNDTIPSLTLGGSTTTSGAVVTTGAGTLTLGGNVTYNAANNPLGASIAGNLNLGATARTFNVGDSSTAPIDLTVSAATSGTGGLTKTGAGTLLLSNANSYGGNTTLSAGVLRVTNTAGLGTSTVFANTTTGTLELLNNGVGNNGTIVYGNNFTINSGNTPTIHVGNNGANTGNNIVLGNFFVGLVTINTTGADGYGLNIGALTTGAGSGTITLNPTTANLSVASFTGNNSTKTLLLTGSSSDSSIGPIANGTAAVAIQKSGSGTWTLNSANTHSGGVNLLAANTGVLRVTNTGGFGTGQLVNNGGTLELLNNGVGNNGTITYGTSSAVTNSGNVATIHVGNNGANTGNTVVLTNGNYNLGNSTLNVTGANGYSLSLPNFSAGGGGAGTAVLNPTTANLILGTVNNQNFGHTLELGGTSTGNQITGTISDGAGTMTISKTGSSTWTLSGNNTYTGNTTVSGGTLKAGSTTALGADGNDIFVTSGGMLDVNGSDFNNRDYDITIAGTGVGGLGAVINNGVDRQDGFKSLTLSANASIGGTGRWDVRPSAGTGTVDLAGFTLTKTGTNLIALVDSNITSSGSINIDQGTLAMTRNTVSGAGSVNVNPGTTLQFENYSSGSYNKAITVNNGTIRLIGNDLVLGASATIDLTNTATFDIDNNRTLTVPGNITGGGILEKVNGGTLILSGANSYSGETIIDNGTLVLASPGSLQNSDVNVNAGTFLQSGGTNNVTGTTGNLNIANGAEYQLNGGDLDFHDTDLGNPSTLNIAAGGTFDFNGGRLMDVTTIDTSGGVFQQGDNPANGGRFVVGRDLAAGQILAEVTTIQGGYTQLGGALALDIFGQLENEIDMLVVNGDVTMNGSIEANTNGVDTIPFQWYNAVKTGEGFEIALGGTFNANGLNFRVIDNPNGPGQLLQIAVPEPAGVLLWSLLAAGLALYARRRRKP